jgi:streptogramin lyase
MSSPRRQRRFADILRFSGGAPRMARRKRATTPQPGDVTQYPAGGGTSSLIIGPEQNIWFGAGSDIGFFNPSTLALQTFPATTGLIQELAVGDDGNVWFVVSFGNPGYVGRCTPGGQVETWPIHGWSADLVLGEDGNIWFNEMGVSGLPGKAIGSVTASGTVSEYATTSDTQDPIIGPGGNIWFGESGAFIGTVTSNGVVTEYAALPGTTDLLVTPDGNVWFGSQTNLGFVTPSGALTTIDTGGNGTYGLILGPGETVWFGSQYSNQVGQAALDGTLVGMYETSGVPIGLCLGGDGNVWFTQLADAIGSVTPAGVVSEYATFGMGPWSPILGSDGNVWFPDGGDGTILTQRYIGRVTPNGTVSEFRTSGLPNSLLNSPGGGSLIYFGENAPFFGSVAVG